MKHTIYAITLASIAAHLTAQENQAIDPSMPFQELDTITVVTGTLWESELQSTTASITLLESEQLEASGAQHFGDIINSIPNVTWTGGSSRPRYIQIRGIGENSQFEGETPDASVRFTVDDLDFTGIGTIGNLFDVQQVEVLRGPQAGAFGVNAAGGVIKIVTNQPTAYWSGQVEATVGEDNLRAGGIAVGGPIIASDPQRLTFRLSAYQLNQDGFRDNTFLGRSDTNERDEFNSRLKVRWLAGSDWQWDGTLFYADANNGYDEFSLNNAGFTTVTDQPGRDEQVSLAGAIRGTWTGLDHIDVTSITSYTTTNSTNSYDADWTNTVAVPLFTVYSGFLQADRERDVFSQEIRADSKDRQDALGWIDRWTVGAYAQDFSEATDVDYTDEYASGIVHSEYDTQSFAIYGQLGHDFSQRLRLTLGLRYEYNSVDFESITKEDYFGSLLSGTNDTSDSLFGGKVTLEYDLNEHHTTFAGITRGYKAGGANSAAFREAGQPLIYDTEILWNYELGLRSDWMDGTVSTQVTVFYLDRKDTQLRDSDGAGGFFRYFTSNQGNANHYGLEAETTWMINANWSASLGVGFIEAESDRRDRDLANAPHYTYNARIDYQSAGGFFANLEVVGSDSYFESNSNDEQRSAFDLFNGAIGYRYQNWTLTLWGRNLFDEDYEKRVFFFDNGYGTQRYENPADPQQFGATLNYSW